MASQETPEQRATVRRVMHEFKHGELESSRGGKVRNSKQAVAIALSESGASNQQSAEANRRQLSRSKRKERAGQTAQAEAEGQEPARRTLQEGRRGARRSRADRPDSRGGDKSTRKALYAEAARKGISGRSRMNKEQLARALRD